MMGNPQNLIFGRGSRFLLFLLLGLLLASCAEAKGFERPNGVVIAADGSLFVMDFGNYRIAHVSAGGRLVKSLGSFGPEAGQIFYGWDLATDSQGNLYFGNVVRDNEGTRHDGVKVFSPQGKFLREIGARDYPVDSNIEPALPYGVEIDSADRVYVSDYGTNEVRIFTREGGLLLTLPGEGDGAYAFVNPGDVAVDDLNGRLYLSDFTLGSILQFSLDWSDPSQPGIAYEKTVGAYGRDPGQFAFPQNLAVDDRSGVLYVADMANRRVQAIGADGEYIASYTPPDVQDWQALGLAVGPQGQVAVGDALNNAIWLFSPSGGQPTRLEVRP